MVWLCKKICFLLIMACWPQGPRGWSHSSVVKYFTSFFSWEFISWVILTLMWWTKQPTCPWNPLDQLLKNWLLFQLIYRQLIVINMTKHQEIWPHANKGRLGVNHRDLISFLLVRLKGYASFITLLLIQGARGPNQPAPSLLTGWRWHISEAVLITSSVWPKWQRESESMTDRLAVSRQVLSSVSTPPTAN